MLLRNYLRKDNAQSNLAIGQTALSLAALALLLGTSRILHFLGEPEATLDFMKGFFMGVGGAFIGVSIVFNIRGLILFRRENV